MPLFREKVAEVGLFGANRDVFEQALAGKVPFFYEPTLRAAAIRLFAAAKPGDIILLSPATASFDLYPSYKARGLDFQQIFADLPVAARETEGDKA